MSEFIKELISSSQNVSSKRVVGIVGFLALLITFLYDVFSGKQLILDVEIVKAIEYITIGALFGTSLDKIMGK
ncbi:hypothetical protein OAA15_00280 [bacterium]|nr:hypothetical protein [bacterium]